MSQAVSISKNSATSSKKRKSRLRSLLLEKRLRRYKKNPFQIIRDGLMKIKTKNEGIIHFIPNNIQLAILDYIEERWANNKPILINILKARQFGVTTLISLLYTVLTDYNEGVNSIVISDKLEGSQYIVDMYKLAYRELRRINTRLMNGTRRDNVNGLEFKNSLSRVLIDTASNVSAGRKYTLTLVHNSEQAFWPINPKELMLGLMQAIPDTRSIVINETTANGVGDYFYNEFVKGVEGDSDWHSMFFGFQEYVGYEMDYTKEEKEYLLLSLTDEENKLIEFFKNKYKFSEDTITRKLIWRRWCIKNKCQGDIDFFHQEYPSTWEEAFLVSGRARFNTKSLLKLKDKCIEPIKRGMYNFAGVWEDLPAGPIQIFKEPVPEYGKYTIGVDTAEGILVSKEGGRPDLDNNSVHVLESKTNDVVATISMQGDPDIFAEQAWRLAIYYNNAFTGIENNKGQAVISFFKRMNYWNMYQSNIYDEYFEREQKVIGWNTNQKTRRLMIDELAAFIREMHGNICDAATIKELFTFIIQNDGTVSAQKGCKDDRVISLGIAVQMLKHQGYMEEKLMSEKAPYGSYQQAKEEMIAMDNAKRDSIDFTTRMMNI